MLAGLRHGIRSLGTVDARKHGGFIFAHSGLRGLAAVMVVFYHCRYGFGDTATGALETFFASSFLFVDLFFLLSGFILYRIYAPTFEGGVTAGAFLTFMAQRLGRLYPNYLAWIAIPIAVSAGISLVTHRHFDFDLLAPELLVAHVLMLQSILSLEPMLNVPLWSITTEVAAYALLPLIVLALAAHRHGAALFLLAYALFVGWMSTTDSIDVIRGVGALTRCVLGFAAGTALARGLHLLAPLSPTALSALQVVALGLSIGGVATGHEALAIFGFGVLVWSTGVNRGVVYGVLRLRAFQILGALSFSIYLCHTTALDIGLVTLYKLDQLAGGTLLTWWPLPYLSVLALSLAMAVPAHLLIELPGQRWCRRLFLSRRAHDRGA